MRGFNQKTKLVALLLFFYSLFSIPFLVAQSPVSFRNLTKKEGLSQLSVFAIEQDDEGFMWFGTRDGLNKFDGYQFTIYRFLDKPGSIVANDVRTLFFDKKIGDLWVGTSSGLSRYRKKKDDFITTKSSGPHDISKLSIRTIYRDSKERLWVGTSSGLYLYQDDNNLFVPFFHKDAIKNTLSDNDVKAILEDQNGVIWFGTESGIDRLIERGDTSFSFQRIAISKQLSDRHIKSILEDENGDFWIGTQNGGINFWDKKEQKVTPFLHQPNNENSISSNNVRSMIWGRDKNIWIGTFYGLNKFNPKKRKFERFSHNATIPSSLSHSSVRATFLDKRGSLWIGTYAGGVNFWDAANARFTNFTHHPYQNSISHNLVSCFTEEEDGNWWIGTEGGGLNFFDTKTKQFTVFKHQQDQPNSFSGSSVKTLFLEKNQLWIGTFHEGMSLFDIPSRQFTHFKNEPNNSNSLSSNNVYGFYKDGQNLWIATYGGGLNILDVIQQKNVFFNYNSADSTSISSDLCRIILNTKSGKKWIGTDNGLNKVHCNQQGFPVRFDRCLTNKKIYSLLECSHEYIWAGTLSDGLFKLTKNGEEIAHFTMEDGLPGNSIFGILLDAENNFWLSTNNGISKFNPKTKGFTNYSYSDGLENLEFNFNAYYKTAAGEMLFGGSNGFTLFNPSDINVNAFVPPVVFTHLEVQNKAVGLSENGILKKVLNETEQLTFNYKEANFSISFAALDYFSPENNHFAYQLEGVDKDWIYSTGKTEATYTIQNAGDYLFRLKGGNSDGVWNESERQLKIIVLPPLWKTTGAYLIYVLLISGIIYGIIRFFRLQHRLQLEQITKKQQEELHEMKVRFFTNITHEFRTPLTLIIGQLEELTKPKKYSEGSKKQKLFSVKKNANRLLNLVNELLIFRKLEKDHIRIRAEYLNINTFLQDIYFSFRETALTQQVDFQFIRAEDAAFIWFDREKLEVVFFNLLSNAFKFTPESGQIILKVKRQKNGLVVSVSDNGIGIATQLHEQVFKRYFESEIPQKRKQKGSGIGLAIAKQMVALHAGKIELISEKNQGAKFTVLLPYGHAHFKENELIRASSEQKKSAKTIFEPPVFKDFNSDNNKSTEESISEDAFKLLIVEDNAEVSDFIQSIFKNKYKLSIAINGKEGLKKAVKVQPDLIISDVMMPEMDGIELCERLKTNLRTSHIPIILLTANTSSESKLNGLENGADDYVTKPFSPTELQLRVRNLVKVRMKLRDKFSRILNLEPTSITVTSADEEFLKNAMDVVEKHIDNSDFGVVQFAFEVAVSRPLLFTKLKGITGQTPNNFIKTIRLKRAAQILKQKKINVSEVANKVGFKDVRYFSKCFQKQFEKTPTAFMEDGGVG